MVEILEVHMRVLFDEVLDVLPEDGIDESFELARTCSSNE